MGSDVTIRPTKRRKVRKNRAFRTLGLALSFIDVEARDTDNENDDDDEDAGPSDFIDDTAVSTCRRHVNLRSSRSRSAGVEEIVQGIYARAKARGLDLNEPSAHQHWNELVPMYIISTPPSILPRLVPYLKKLDGTRRVVRSPDKRSIVYVETTGLTSLTNAIDQWPGWGNRYRPQRPVPMSLHEQQNLILRLRDKESAHKTVDLLAYHWVRVLDMNSAYNLDLVFVLSQDNEYSSSHVISKGGVTGLVVPRIDYRPLVTQFNRTPAALFDPECIKYLFPDKEPIWNAEKGIWKWADLTFTASGLLLVTLTRDMKLVVDGVQPTDEELALFLSSDEPILDRPASTQSCAVHPGDLVIIDTPDMPSPHDKKVGYLIDITQRSGGCFATVKSRTRSNVTAGLQHFEVPVSLVKHHILATPRNLLIGDRVCIVTGPELGTSGRLVEFMGDDEISVLLSTSEVGVTVSVDKRHVRHIWRLGDVVEIIRGTYRGLVALIVGILPGGMVMVYSKKNYNDTGSAFNVRTADLQFALTQTTGIRDAPSNIRPNLQSAVRYTQDRQWDAWEEDMREKGNLLRHMEVLFIGHHPDKGMHGSIVDYHRISQSDIGMNGEETESMETLVEQAELTIRIDITSRLSKAYSSQVMERYSFLPIATAALFKSLKMLHIFNMPEKPINEPEIPLEDNDYSWGIPPASTIESRSGQCSKRTTPDICETTGRWLAHPNLVGRRIDVCVVPMQELTEIARRYPKLVSDGRINKATYDRADAQKPGTLEPLKQQVKLKGLERRRVKVKFPLGRDASMPVVTLRPCRTTYDGFDKETDKCISTTQSRVIIIGPDIDGCDANIGEYAQTKPDADQLPSTFVNVKFARTDGRQIEQQHSRYHLNSLCRATNAPLIGFELMCPTTDFDLS